MRSGCNRRYIEIEQKKMKIGMAPLIFRPSFFDLSVRNRNVLFTFEKKKVKENKQVK
jgi:hypothetical protein